MKNYQKKKNPFHQNLGAVTYEFMRMEMLDPHDQSPEFLIWEFLNEKKKELAIYSGENNYLIPSWFCKFAHLQRN